MKLIELSFTGTTPQKVLVNIDKIVTIERNEGATPNTRITFDFPFGNANGFGSYVISVIETPQRIQELINAN